MQVRAAENPRPFSGHPRPPKRGRRGGAATAKEMGHRGTRTQLGRQVAGVESAAGAGAPARRSLGDPFCGRAVKGGWKEVIYANRPNEAGKKKQTIIWKGSDLFPPSSMSAVTTDAPQGRGANAADIPPLQCKCNVTCPY